MYPAPQLSDAFGDLVIGLGLPASNVKQYQRGVVGCSDDARYSDTWGTAASLCFPGDIVAAGQVLRIMRCLNLGYGMLCTPHLPMICFICTHTHTPHLSSIFHGLSTAISNARETMRKGEHFLSGIMLL